MNGQCFTGATNVTAHVQTAAAARAWRQRGHGKCLNTHRIEFLLTSDLMFLFCSNQGKGLKSPWRLRQLAKGGRSAGVSRRGAPVVAKMAQARNQAGSAPIAGSWTWKRLSAHAAENFRCHGSKVDCNARAVAIDE